jgi:deazaflavin-dependent oxidoreductase (nitroreductase family)
MNDTDFNEWNTQIIAEFRANEGKVGGQFEGAPLLLLHSTGAKSGKERVNPLMPRIDGERMFVFASMAGAPRNPDWYYNVKANPEVEVELGTETFSATAQEVVGRERDEVYAAMAAQFQNFAEYEQMTDRTIPVVELVRG